MGCPSEETLSRLAEGSLDEAARAEAMAHVESCDGCRQVVALVAAASRSGQSRTLASPHQRDVGGEELPAVLGRYRVLREVGRGAMGRVFAAEDSLLGRTVALKLVATQVEDVALSARVASEARAVARLTHPNVVALYDVLQVKGWVFLAMEFVEGEDLAAWLAKPHPPDEVMDVFAQAAAGLGAAHAAGVVHRDFKPANVLVGRDGRVRVSDFGLARLFDDASTHAPGHLVGTPAYMAPEQLEGADAGPPSDEFSFFVALHEALTGARPFGAGPMDEVKRRAQAGERVEPPRPLPRALVPMFTRGLAPRPADRYPSMEAARAALLATRPRPLRKRLLAGAAMVLVLGLGAGFGLRGRAAEAACRDVGTALDGAWDAPRRAAVRAAFAKLGKPWAVKRGEEAVQALDGFADQWRAARVDACLATEVRGEASQRLFDLRAWCLDQRKAALASVAEVLAAADLQTATRTPYLLSGLGDVSPCANTRALLLLDSAPVDPQVRAKVDQADALLARAYARQNAGQLKEALALAQQADELARGTGVVRAEADAAFRRGALERLTGSHADAKATLKRATEAAMRSRLGDVEAQAWIERMIVSHYLDEQKQGLELEGTALAAIDRLETGEPSAKNRHQRFLATLHTALGHLSSDLGDVKGARAHFEASLRLDQALAGDGGVETATDLQNLSGVASVEGKAEESLTLIRAAYEINQRHKGDEHPDTVRSLFNLATELHRQRQFEAALPLYQRALELNRAIYGDENIEIASNLDNLGALLRSLKRPEEGLKLQLESLELRKKLFGDDALPVANSCTNLGNSHFQQGHFKEALPYFQCAYAIFEKKKLLKHPNAIIALANLAETRHLLGDSKAAREDMVKVLELDEEVLGAAHPSVAYDAVQVGIVEVKLGLTQEATAHFQRALALEGTADVLDVAQARIELAKLALAKKPRDPAQIRDWLEKARVPFAAEMAKGRGSGEVKQIDALLKRVGGP